MGSFTNTAKNTMLDALESTYTIYAALFNGQPSVAGVELTGGSPAYARQAVTLAAAASGQILVTADETFDVASGSTVNYIALYDAVTAGNLLAEDDVTEETYGAQGQYILDSQTLTI